MDDQHFDTLVRALAAGITRRGTLGILAGLAGVHVADATAAKRRHKRDRGKGASKNKGGKKLGRAQAAVEKNDDKVTICHRTGSAKNPVVVIEVSKSAIPAHEEHGDTISPDFDSDPENCGGCAVSCDDDNLCTTDTCAEGKCNNDPIDCDDGNVCTDHSCDRAIGCTQTVVPGRTCDDGNACTADDRCQADGTCRGAAIDCDDGIECTVDDCDPATGCTHTPDHSLCVSDDPCETGRCVADRGCVFDPVDTPECRGRTCGPRGEPCDEAAGSSCCRSRFCCGPGEYCSRFGCCAEGPGPCNQ